jgi:hypothetical protein
MNNVKLAAGGIVAAVVLLAVAIFGVGLFGHNNTTTFQIVQPVQGEAWVRDASGYYYKGFATVWTYDRVMVAKYEHDKDKSKDQSIRVTFNDSGNADIGAYARIELPTTPEKRLLLHKDFQGNPDNIKGAIRAHLVNCVKASGPVMSASENQSSRKSEFNQIVEEQLKSGLFKMKRTSIELDDLSELEEVGVDANGVKITREKKARVQATEIVHDKDGKPIVVQASPLLHYNLFVNQFSITETEYDDATLRQFGQKKESYLNAERSKAQRQEEVQSRLMIEEKGRRQVAEIQAEENQKKERALIQAQQEADVAVINKDKAVTAARQKVEVASQLQAETETYRKIAEIKAQTAELDKKATIAAAEAQQKAIELGGGISEEKKVLAQIGSERDIGVAKALAGVNVPQTVVSSGGSGGDGQGNLLNLALLKYMGVLKDPPATK